MTMAKFNHAVTRQPADTVSAGLTTRSLGQPDAQRTQQQYQRYLDALRDYGVQLTTLPANTHYPDGHYVEDTGIIYGDLLVITQPGANERRHEPEAIANALPHTNRVYMTGEAYLDGGDVLFCADRVLIGLSHRTNRAGAEFLSGILRDYDSRLKVDFVPIEGVLHLKTGITELAPGVLLRAPELHCDYDFSFAEIIMLPANEGYAANVLPVNGGVLIPKGFPSVAAAAEKYYTHITELEMDEFEKMDGSLTCLSLRFNL